MVHYDLLIKDATVVFPDRLEKTDVAILDGKIADIGFFPPTRASQVINASGLHLLPGVIDSQVHFREPGFEYKEDLESGTRAAILGGVTAIMEMPNTNPPTITQAALDRKVAIAEQNAWCDFAFFIGGHVSNPIVDWAELESLRGASGIKIFMGSSTGDLLVAQDEAIRNILLNSKRRVAIHAEDEERLLARRDYRIENDVASHPIWRDEQTALLATKRIVKIAKETGRKVHVLHITTADELPVLAAHKAWASMEVTPQHLTLDASSYAELGSYMQMNPPVRDKKHQDALWRAVQLGLVDVIGSDHAPHTTEEKQKNYPQSPSGMPGVQTMLPLMLTHMNAQKISLLKLVDLLAAGPARVYGIATKGRIVLGLDADFALVDLHKKYVIENKDMAYKCGWTPFNGMQAQGKVQATFVRGMLVMQDGEPLAKNASPIMFYDTLKNNTNG